MGVKNTFEGWCMKIPSLPKKWFLLFLLALFLGCGTATTEPTDVNDTEGAEAEPTSPTGTGSTGKTPWSYHETNWADPTLHAAAFSANEESCKTCHGNNYERKLQNKNCFTCHSFPHNEGWLNYQGGHGQTVTFSGSTEDCQQCHGADLKTEKNGQTCFSCHPS